jgi:hypothetical protein
VVRTAVQTRAAGTFPRGMLQGLVLASQERGGGPRVAAIPAIL